MVGAQTRDEKTTSVPSSSLHSLANEAFAEVIFCRIKNNNMAALWNIFLAKVFRLQARCGPEGG